MASLSAVRVFEAAARLGSFRAASEELHLSPSAVSHAISKLEKGLGTSLFERNTRQVVLTPDGQTLFGYTSNALEELRRGIEMISPNKSHLLRVHCAPSYAAKILSPLLPDFLHQNPGVEVRIAANTDYARFIDGLCDVDIIYGEPQNRDDLITIPLTEEWIAPICSPCVAARLKSPLDLRRLPLIRSDFKRIQWKDWFEFNHLGSPPPPTMSFDRSFLALDAAANGLGIALESNLLAHKDLAYGRLVLPLTTCRDGRYIGHYLSYPKTGMQRRLAAHFAHWLSDTVAATLPAQTR